MAATERAVDGHRQHLSVRGAAVYLNEFAQGMEPVDLTGTAEFASLLASAADLGIAHGAGVRCTARNVVVNGLRFHVLEWGNPANPPVLLLHGGNQTAHSWDFVSLHLADRFRVVAFDQRGHGDSEWPRDCESTFEQMASDAAGLIELTGLRRPAVIGHSMGGLVALKLIAGRPDIAERAVIVDVGPEVSTKGSKVIGNFVRSVGEYDSEDAFVERVAAYDPYRPIEHIRRTARYNLLRRADGKFVTKHDVRRRELASVREAVRSDWPVRDEVRGLALPVLLVRGGDSEVLTDDLARAFVASLPQGRLVTVPNAAHNVHSQNTQGFLDVVVPFLEQSATPPTVAG